MIIRVQTRVIVETIINYYDRLNKVPRALLGFSDSLLFDFYVTISRTFRILVHSSVTYVSRAHLGFSFTRLLRKHLSHSQAGFSSVV